MIRYVLLLGGLSAVLSGCGSSESRSGMKISCSRGTSIEPVSRLEIRQIPAVGSAAPTATLSYPDPLHPDTTGTLTLGLGEKCTVAPTTKA